MLRLSLALFVTPLFAVLIYFVAFFLFTMIGGGEPPELFAFMVGFLPYTYAGTIIFILPLVVFFEQIGKQKLWQYLIAGGGLGAVITASTLVIFIEHRLTVDIAFQAGVASIAGCLVAAIFWTIAFLGKKPH